jgi:RNA polymerase sigma factor CnrH
VRGRTDAVVEIRPEEAESSGIRPGSDTSGVAGVGGAAGSQVGRTAPHLTLLRSSPDTAESSGEAVTPHRVESGPRDPESCTDGELVTLALNGGAAAFSHLLRRHARHLRAVITRRLRDPEDVRDAVQDTHFAVWRALRHYDAGRPFEAWITTIAINKCRDAARRRATQLGMLSRLRSDAVHDCGFATEQRGLERLLIGKESVRCLGRALEALPPQLRAPLLLTSVREHSQAAVARELGLTRKAVEMRVRRARQHLARTLDAAYA